ncbi:MAG: adenylate kinase [Acidobacteriota bacterium]
MVGGAGGGLRLVIFGAPGAGKGTQAAEIRRRVGLAHVATGDMLRAAIQEGTALGRRVKEIVERGGLVPDDVVGELVRRRLERPDARDGFLLDGFPRTMGQARILDRILAERGAAIDRVLNIVVDEAEILDRLSGRRTCDACGRPFHVRLRPPRTADVCDACGGELRQREDDTQEAISRRLRAYRDQTAPLIESYERRGLLTTIDGKGSPGEVYSRIEAAWTALRRRGHDHL